MFFRGLWGYRSVRGRWSYNWSLGYFVFVIINCETQLQNFLNPDPCCTSSKTLCFSKCVIMLLCTKFSKTLQESEVKDMGR